MKALLNVRQRYYLSETCFAEVVIWQLPEPLSGSSHCFKYRMALVEDDVCVLRYDNEAGKGDHKHVGDVETDYLFIDLNRLRMDFRADVENWRSKNG